MPDRETDHRTDTEGPSLKLGRQPGGPKRFADVHATQPLAWDDDQIIYAAEAFPDPEKAPPAHRDRTRSARDRLVRAAREYVRRGHVPQLRMALAPGDTLNDYLLALDKPAAMVLLRRRAAGHLWHAGGCEGLGGPAPAGGPGKWRAANFPYLRAMRVATYGEPEPEPEPLDWQADLFFDPDDDDEIRDSRTASRSRRR